VPVRFGRRGDGRRDGVIGGADERTVADLLGAVYDAANDDPSCRVRGPDRRLARLSALPAADATIRAFPQLRRAPTARERALGRTNGRRITKAVLSGGARELRATDGTRFALLITSGSAIPGDTRRDPACFTVRRAELKRRAAGVEPAVYKAARRALERDQRAYRANLGREGLIFGELADDGGVRGALCPSAMWPFVRAPRPSRASASTARRARTSPASCPSRPITSSCALAPVTTPR